MPTPRKQRQSTPDHSPMDTIPVCPDRRSRFYPRMINAKSACANRFELSADSRIAAGVIKGWLREG